MQFPHSRRQKLWKSQHKLNIETLSVQFKQYLLLKIINAQYCSTILQIGQIWVCNQVMQAVLIFSEHWIKSLVLGGVGFAQYFFLCFVLCSCLFLVFLFSHRVVYFHLCMRLNYLLHAFLINSIDLLYELNCIVMHFFTLRKC